MAENEARELKDDDLDLATEAKKPGFMSKLPLKKILLFGGGGLLLVGVSVGATLLLTGGLSGGDGEAAATEEKSAQKAPPKAGKPKANRGGEVIYFSLEPAFVVNFTDKSGIRYLQVNLEAMTHDAGTVDDINKHMPAIRNSIVLLLSGQTSESIGTREGKQKIRADVLREIQKVLKERTGKAEVEAVYFTSFVVQ